LEITLNYLKCDINLIILLPYLVVVNKANSLLQILELFEAENHKEACPEKRINFDLYNRFLSQNR
jgi:hypothetical protein